MKDATVLIFSGHNQRAVFSLLKRLRQNRISTSIIESYLNDPVKDSIYQSDILLKRTSRALSKDLFQKIVKESIQKNPLISRIILIPTSEYINTFFLKNINFLQGIGLIYPIRNHNSYTKLTNKYECRELVQRFTSLSLPKIIDPLNITSPFIAKPKKNIKGKEVLYPHIIMEPSKAKISDYDTADWYFEDFIQGQSFYYCGYLDRYGNIQSYWQKNYIQQSNGKSILLAKSTRNPGVNTRELNKLLKRSEFSGPFMFEIIKSGSIFYFIEINPRFWGPFELSFSANSKLFQLFLKDLNFKNGKLPKLKKNFNSWYSWKEGFNWQDEKYYPCIKEIEQSKLRALIYNNDVYKKLKINKS